LQNGDDNNKGGKEEDVAINEATSASGSSTKNRTTTARQFLKSQKLLDEEKTDLSSLTLALKKIADQISKTKGMKLMGESVKAVAVLIEEVVVSALAEKIAKDVMNQLSTFSAHMEAASDHLDQVVEHGTLCAKKLEEQCAGAKTIMEEAGRTLLEAMTDLTTTGQAMQDRKEDERSHKIHTAGTQPRRVERHTLKP
jgi:hypothetical protein